MLWKWVFLAVLAVCLGVIWQSEEYRKLFLLELNHLRLFTNSLTKSFEGWQVIFITAGFTLLLAHFYHIFFGNHINSLRTRARTFLFKIFRKLPLVRSKIKEEVDKALDDLEKESFKPKAGEKHRTELPKKGLTHEEVLNEIAQYESLADVEWDKGWVSGGLYYSSPELTKLTTEVFGRYVWSNPLHPDVFPQIRKMEAEVVQWGVNLFHGDSDACGIMTSGGTESIILAMKAYREVGYAKGIEYPEIVCPASAHCAFNKAASFMRMKLVKVPVDPRTMMADVKATARAINGNTVVLVASAPQFPHGIIDPIQELARLALKNNIGLHVDCCLGGFVLPFMDKAGFKIDPFDFRVKGVTSISADTHKFGYTPKGTSLALYSSRALREKQYFIDASWQGGIYATAGMPGSRPGALIAATWATLMYMGEDGYVDATKKIIRATKAIIKGLENVPGIKVVGKPQAMIVAVSSSVFDVIRLSDAMGKKGWHLNALQMPPSVHLCVTMVHTKEGVGKRFVSDMKACVEVLMKDPKAKPTSGQAAMYGKAAAIPESLIHELATGYLNLTYRAAPPNK